MNIRKIIIDNKQIIIELFLYAFFGVVGTLVNVLIFVVLTKYLNIQYLISNFVAWIFSIFFAFVTNKIWVFKSKSWKFVLLFRELVLFLISRILTLIFDMGYIFLAISIFNFNATISKIIANFIVIVANYGLSKTFIFKINNEKSYVE